jgi:hypothetical protein
MTIIGVVVLIAGVLMVYMGFTDQTIGAIMKTVFGNG